MDLLPSDPSRILPHRPPFLLLDQIAAVVPGRVATGWKRIVAGECRAGEPWPRVLLVEMMAQTAATLLFPRPEAAPARLGLLAGVPEMSFRRSAYPGETVVATSELERRWGRLARFAVKAHIGGELAAVGSVLLAAPGP